MKKLGTDGRKHLKNIHIVLCCAWIGTSLSLLLIGLVKIPSISNGDELYATLAVIKLLDDYIIVPAAIGLLLTGLLYSKLTHWGFFKYRWITIKWVIIAAQIAFGTAFLGQWVGGAYEIVEMERALALESPQFMQYVDDFRKYGCIQTLFLL
jgi:hypothetical protein